MMQPSFQTLFSQGLFVVHILERIILSVKKNVYIMYAIALMQGMVFYAPVSMLYRQAQGISYFQIAMLESISLLFMLALEIPWGVAADRIGYRNTMIICEILFFISKLLFWRAYGFWGFLGERILLSAALAGLSGVDTSMLYLSCQRQEDSQKAFGIYSSMGTIGLLFASGVFTLLVGDNYRLAGLLTVVSYGIAAALAFGLTEVKVRESRGFPTEYFRETLGKVLRDRRLLLLLLAVALLSETHQTVTVFLNQLQYERCGLGSAAMGGVYMAATVIGMCGAWSAAVTKKLGAHGVFALFSTLGVLACIVLAITCNAILSVAGILMLCLTDSLFQPFQTEIQHRQVQTGNRATALSVHAMLIDGVGIGTNLVFGALTKASLSAAFLFGGGICLLSLLFFSLWARDGKATTGSVMETK